MLRFTLIFFVLVTALFALELWQPVQRAVVIPFTTGLATVSASIMGLFDASVMAAGKLLFNTKTGFGVTIEAGCNGVEAAIILAAAIFAYRAPFKYKLAGFLAGLVTVQVLNLLRIITLYYLGQWNAQLFEWAHLYLWQALIMLDVLIVWLLWLRWMPSTTDTPVAQPAAQPQP